MGAGDQVYRRDGGLTPNLVLGRHSLGLAKQFMRSCRSDRARILRDEESHPVISFCEVQ